MRVCVNCHKGKTFIETIHMRCQDKKLLKCLFILIFHKSNGPGPSAYDNNTRGAEH
jgi:hypothetical protein